MKLFFHYCPELPEKDNLLHLASRNGEKAFEQQWGERSRLLSNYGLINTSDYYRETRECLYFNRLMSFPFIAFLHPRCGSGFSMRQNSTHRLS